ncbi:hypothetical protein INR49_009133 [Caranx melampygus]|nr:hypothetical protein INR49_009133 [Caranx melampygus]
MQVLCDQMSSNINIYHQPLSKNTSDRSDCERGPSLSLQTCRELIDNVQITANACVADFVQGREGSQMASSLQR